MILVKLAQSDKSGAMVQISGIANEFFFSMHRKQAKLSSEFLNYERINSLAMQPAYLLTSILSVVALQSFANLVFK